MFASGSVDLEVAAIGGCAVILAAAIPAWLNARKTKHVVGTPNGNGTVIDMLETSLVNQGQVKEQVARIVTQLDVVAAKQEAHTLEDHKRFRVVFDHLGIPYNEENN